MRWTSPLVGVLGLIVVFFFVDAAGAEAPRGPRTCPPWLDPVPAEAGHAFAAAGRGPDGTPFVLTVWGAAEGTRIARSTTFVRGRTALRIERIYRPEVGLEVTYMAGGERLSIASREDPAGGGLEMTWRLPGGKVIVLRHDRDGSGLRGDLGLLRSLLMEPRPLFSAMRGYAAASKRLRVPLAENVRFFPLRAPDAGCWAECASGCDEQCRLYCATVAACVICTGSCYAGCAIGCM
jgi:hypothetical protein